MEVFLYLLDMYIDFQFILSSCGCIGNRCMMEVGLLLPHQTKSFVPVLYIKGRIKSRIGSNYQDTAIREIVVDQWKSLSLEYINDLIFSMPRRLEAVIAANGGNNFAG